MIFLAISESINASNTNIVYLPVDSKVYFGESAQEMSDAEQLKKAKNSEESRPAELDPNGHWGKVAGGTADSQTEINWGKNVCEVQFAITIETNTVTAGQAFRITEHIKNSSTNSIALHSVEQYLVSDSGKKYKLPSVLDISTESGPNIDAPYTVESGKIDEIPYTVKINADIQPGDFTIIAIEHIATSDKKACEIPPNSLKVTVVRN